MSTFTVAEMLAELNGLRAARNQAPLKSWKGARTALEQTVAAYKAKAADPSPPVVTAEAAVAKGAYPNATVAEHATALKGTDAKAREKIAAAKDKPAKKQREGGKTVDTRKKAATVKTHNTSEFFSLANIARSLGIEPKLARAKARRSDEIAKLAQGDAWVFKPNDVATVKKLLKS